MNTFGRTALAAGASALALAALVALAGPTNPSSDRAERPPPSAASQRPAQRVVSLIPAATELTAEMGLGHRIVGRTRFDDHPAVASAPVVGDAVHPPAEVVLSLDPDLILTWADVTDPRLVRGLEDAGLVVHPVRMETLDDVARTTREIARLLGAPAIGERLAGRMVSGLDTLARSAPPVGERPCVLLLLDPPTLLTAGPGSYLDEIVRAAGGRNVFADLAGRWGRASAEAVLARDPDAVVVATRPGPGGRPPEPLWSSLRAVRTGRVLRIPADRLTRPGLHAVGLARELRSFLGRDAGGAR